MRARLIGIWFAGTLLLGPASVAYLAAPSESQRLQGTWEVLSVYRDGSADPAQVGAHLTFAGDRVTLKSKVVRVTDWPS